MPWDEGTDPAADAGSVDATEGAGPADAAVLREDISDILSWTLRELMETPASEAGGEAAAAVEPREDISDILSWASIEVPTDEATLGGSAGAGAAAAAAPELGLSPLDSEPDDEPEDTSGE